MENFRLGFAIIYYTFALHCFQFYLNCNCLYLFSFSNEPVSCKGYSIPRIDLYPWKEDPHSSNYKPKYSQYQKRPSHKPSKPKIPYEQSQYKAEYYGPYKPEHYETYRTRPEYYKPEIYSFEQRIPNKYHEREYRGNRRY